MIKKLIAMILPLAALVFSGCETVRVTEIPESLRYKDPDLSDSTATVTGSEKKSGAPLLDKFTTFIVSIDGLAVMSERKGWDEKLIIESGSRILTVEFNRGVFVGRADLKFDAEAGHDYAVKFDTDVKVYGKNSRVDFWIEDVETNEPVTGVVRASINGGSTYTPIFIPVY